MVGISNPTEKEFSTGAELLVGVIAPPLYMRIRQTGVGTVDANLSDNAVIAEFKFDHLPTAPTGWTLKGRLSALCASLGAADVSCVLRNHTDGIDTVETGVVNNEAMRYVKSALFTIPAATKTHRFQIKVGGAITGDIYAAWVDLVIQKD